MNRFFLSIIFSILFTNLAYAIVDTTQFADKTVTINYTPLSSVKTHYLACDWNGDGIKTPGIVNNGVWNIRNSNTSGSPDLVFNFGLPTDIPVCGNWNSDTNGKQTAGVFRPSNGQWLLRSSNSDGFADIDFIFGGLAGDVPIVGHWTGTKQDLPGVFRNGIFIMRNSLTTGFADTTIPFGNPGDIPIIGDWTGMGKSMIGVVRNTTWFIRKDNSNNPTVEEFMFGNPGDVPVLGNWTGGKIDNPAIVRNQTWYMKTTFFNYEGKAIKKANDPITYLVENGKRRGFPDWDTYLSKGFKDGDQIVLADSIVDSIPMGTVLPSTKVTPNYEGKAIKKANDPITYLVENGKRRGFPDWDTYLSKGFKDGDQIVLADSIVDSIPMGTVLPSTKVTPNYEGKVIKKASDPTSYLIENGAKRRFPDWDTYLSKGFKDGDQIVLADSIVDAFPMGADIPSVFPPGDFDKDRDVDLADFGLWKSRYLSNTSTLSEFGVWKSAYLANPVTHFLRYGNQGDIPITGNWSGGTIDYMAIVRGNDWLMKNKYEGEFADKTVTINYTPLSSVKTHYLACDWNGDGIKTPGIVNNGVWNIRNSNTSGSPDLVFNFGLPTDIPVCGNWNSDTNGKQTAGVFRPSNGQWLLRSSNSDGFADIDFIFGGLAGDVPIVGHWTGTKQDLPGVFRNGIFIMRNSLTTGFADTTIPFGNPGDIPIIGDWTGRGVSMIGVYRSPQFWYLRVPPLLLN